MGPTHMVCSEIYPRTHSQEPSSDLLSPDPVPSICIALLPTTLLCTRLLCVWVTNIQQHRWAACTHCQRLHSKHSSSRNLPRPHTTDSTGPGTALLVFPLAKVGNGTQPPAQFLFPCSGHRGKCKTQGEVQSLQSSSLPVEVCSVCNELFRI